MQFYEISIKCVNLYSWYASIYCLKFWNILAYILI